MAVITIKIQNKDGMTLSVARGEDEAALVYTKEYEEGDEIIFEISPKNAFYELMADDAALARLALPVTVGDVGIERPGNRLCDRGCPLQDSVRGEKDFLLAQDIFREPAFNHRKACGYDMLWLLQESCKKCDGPAWGDQLLSACVGECGDARGGGVRRQKRDRRCHGE